ncbi:MULTISPECIES: helix-turn-helix domain-containing protein [Thermus]|uniref:Transcriptional regulator n=1 Tax=Thermus scotoductus TaxID=37636 RepID=A0A430UQT9_THESC|nr:helix-turn-helix transcriptional regulator [Thermus scotoductus]RTI10502.1 transcriptional regulator [Thermus scotoductus]BDG27217.1 hypothetical protein TthSNM66_18530 [Thermus thermophilus]
MRQLLRTLREERGLSQGALAKKIGVTQGYIHQLERGIRRPSIRVLLRLAQALDVPPETLLRAFKEGA